MSSGLMTVLQQQSAPFHTVSPSSEAWQWWTPEQIAACTQCPLESVHTNWPLLWEALEAFRMTDYEVALGILGTVAVETAHTFEPVREAYWLSEDWRARNLRYYPWYGRGFVQLTWQSNYQYYGEMIGISLTDNLDLAMEPQVAALLMVAYFWDKDIEAPCLARNWREVRRLVQGADAGLDTLIATIECLDASHLG